MAKKTVSKQTTTVAPVENVVEVNVNTTTKKRAPRTVKKVVHSSTESSVVASVPTTVVRRVTTRDTVLEDFDNLVKNINNEVTSLREAGEKGVSFKFVRSVVRQLTHLKTHSQKVMKKRRVTNTEKSHNSIFQLPVPISEELANFNGWNPSEPRSRVEVTRALCKYIKDNSLQDQSDRRIILADAKLCKLLNYTPDKEAAPLNYSRLQSYMKVHFLNSANQPVVAVAAAAAQAQTKPSPSPSSNKKSGSKVVVKK